MHDQDPYLMNRLANASNRFQMSNKYKRVLCICSAGLLRSPTAAWLLGQAPWNHNTRAAGLTPEFALIPVDQVLLEWAQEIVCMTQEQTDAVTEMLKQLDLPTPVLNLNVPDNFGYRDSVLVDLITTAYMEKHAT